MLVLTTSVRTEATSVTVRETLLAQTIRLFQGRKRIHRCHGVCFNVTATGHFPQELERRFARAGHACTVRDRAHCLKEQLT